LTKKDRLLSKNSRSSHCYTELGNGNIVIADGARKIAAIDLLDAALELIGLLEDLGALDGKATIAVTLHLDEERLRTEILVCVVDHCYFTSFRFIKFILDAVINVARITFKLLSKHISVIGNLCIFIRSY